MGIYATIRLFYENNFVKLKCLRVMQRDYNMYKICNQKFMFCQDRGIDFSFWLCVEYTWYARQALLMISTFSTGTMGIPTFRPLDGKRSLFNASTAVENQTFDAGVTEYILLRTYNSMLIHTYYLYILLIIIIINA